MAIKTPMDYPLFTAGWKFNQMADQDIWVTPWLLSNVIAIEHTSLYHAALIPETSIDGPSQAEQKYIFN